MSAFALLFALLGHWQMVQPASAKRAKTDMNRWHLSRFYEYTPLRPIIAMIALLAGAASAAQAADQVVAAGNRLSAIAPLYIASDKGLFAAQGLDVSLVHLTSATEIGAAITSGSAQFGMTAFSA